MADFTAELKQRSDDCADQRGTEAGKVSWELLCSERRKASFAVAELTHELYGGAKNTERKANLVRLLRKDAVFQEPEREYYHFGDRGYLVRRALEKLKRAMELVAEHGLSPMEERLLKHMAGITLIGLHDNVFVPTILGMSTDAQLAEWAPNVLSYAWLGCYAQTEIAHGSNVRGLRTTATWTEEGDSLIVHTPDVSAIKWWPGGMGLVATHAIVYARLIVKDVDHGIHNFLVQIRDVETHRPLPGIELGDIGPKMATNDNDNGFLRFDHVRIPRFNMLMKHTKLDSHGNVSKVAGSEKGSYATMTRVRSGIVVSAGLALSDAVTIAVRFAAVRCQEPGAEVETPIINYISQQYCLVPHLASAYALRFVGMQMFRSFFGNDGESVDSQSDESEPMDMPSLHATSCALKSFCTTVGANGIEECRRACGGYGFHLFSGLPSLYGKYMPLFTAEGNNWLLTQQASRYLLKIAKGADGAARSSDVAHLFPKQRSIILSSRSNAGTIAELIDLDHLHTVFAHAAAFHVQSALDSIEAELAAGATDEEAFRSHLIEHYRISRSHALLITLTAFLRRIRACQQPALATVLTRLCQCFALQFLEAELGDFLLAGFLNLHTSAKIVRPAIKQLLTSLRPDLVALTDAFGQSDWELNSALGRYDGNYIDTLYAWAKADPFNQNAAGLGGPPFPGYSEFLQPLMRSRL